MRILGSREIHIEPHISAQRDTRGPDALIAATATRQRGVVSHEQLTALGLTRHEIGDRIAAGRLLPIHRGVYAVGHSCLSREGRWTAAVLAAGDDAVLSHRAAAALWELRLGERTRIDVTVDRNRRGDRNLRIHRVALAPNEITTRRGIPTTTPLRTLIDIAPQAAKPELERAIREALYQRLVTTTSLTSCLSTYEGRRGIRDVRQVLTRIAEAPGITRSELEQAFIRFLRKRSLPKPKLNAEMRVGDLTIEVDCLWRKQRVIAELDGRAAHELPHAFETDRARDRALIAAGWKTPRITWHAIHRDGDNLADELRALLQPGGGSGRRS